MEDLIIDSFTEEDFIFLYNILSNYKYSLDESDELEYAKQLRHKVKQTLSHLEI
jgi:hypothetical protein